MTALLCSWNRPAAQKSSLFMKGHTQMHLDAICTYLNVLMQIELKTCYKILANYC